MQEAIVLDRGDVMEALSDYFGVGLGDVFEHDGRFYVARKPLTTQSSMAYDSTKRNGKGA